MLNGQVIKEVKSFKYLGVVIDAQLRWKEQTQKAIANATKWILQYRRLTRPATGVNSKIMRQLYLAVAVPKITYGLDVWYTPPQKKDGKAKNSGSVAAMKAIRSTQRIASLAITGSLRTTPTDLLDAHAGILPADLMLKKVCHRSMVRLLTLPESHPLHAIIEKSKRSRATSNLDPIDMLLRLFSLKKTRLETIVPAKCLPRLTLRIKTTIPATREVSIQNENATTQNTKYTRTVQRRMGE
jgi:hypothetical protein